MDQVIRTKDDDKLSASDNNNVISLKACKVSKERKQARKMQNLGTRISSDTLKRFRHFVVTKHGKLNGAFALEVENALEILLNNQQHTTSYALSSKNLVHPRSDVKERYLRIVKELRQLKSFPYINIPTLKRAVLTSLGVTDKRTLEKYLRSVVKLSKQEECNSFGRMPSYDVTRFVEKIQSDDW